MQARYEQFYPSGITAAQSRPIHGDLRFGNLIFTGDTLSGVIDFGGTRRGDIMEEMRGLYRLGRSSIGSCNETLRTKGLEVTFEQVEFWGVGRVVNGLIHTLQEETYQDLFPSNRTFLQTWRPDMDWSELDAWQSRLE